MTGAREFSHYHAATRTWYDVEKCETCDGNVQAPNAVQLCSDPALVPGLIFDETLPPEQFYDETTELCACEGCAL